MKAFAAVIEPAQTRIVLLPERVPPAGVRAVGLPLFESIEFLRRERTVARLRAALDRLS